MPNVLDPAISSLMTNTVLWEQRLTSNVHGEPTYAAGVSKACWIEEASRSQGAVEAEWATGVTTYNPAVDIFLDANDPDVAAMTMLDRFTIAAGVESGGAIIIQQPKDMTVFYGEFGEPWVKNVRL